MTTPTPPDIDDVVNRARDMPPGERITFVIQQCGDDVTLISHIYALLQQDSPGNAHRTQPRESQPQNLIPESLPPYADEWQPDSLLGTRLGSYELTQLIGTGGMGAVYLAQRVDAEFNQKVAIKLVRHSLLLANVAARLRTERQILASLQHPNIATLLDGGTANDGTPYLVMEYIDGVTIDVYCDREKLSIEQRLKLFLEVCAAVQCAHQNLIVHRDLKPNNILVTNHEGQPKLLDFGIAKLLDTQPHRHNAHVTQHDMRMLTPAHASPEQVRGETITTRSDIYVLGVLLYELLCGRRPFILPPHYRLSDLERVVCTSIPQSPSNMVSRVERESAGFMQDLARCRSTTVQRLKRRLRGDLDNIVMMAMRKEPARRYASAEHFANDIQHWLEGLPVVATRDSWRYRTGKFIRRHAVAVSTACIVMIVFIGFVSLTLVQAHNIARQRDAIAEERTRAEQVSTFLVDLFRISDPTKSRGNDLKARELLDVGAKHIDVALSAQPTIRATLLETIGEVYGSLGLNTEAAAAIEKSLNTRMRLYGSESDEVATTLVQLGDIRFSQGEYVAAKQSLHQALGIQQRLHGLDGVEQAATLRLLGKIATELGDFDSAEDSLLRALKLYDTHGQYDSLDKAITLGNLGDLRASQYRDSEAETLFRAALASTTSLLGTDHPQVMDLRINLADALESQDKYSEAQPIFEAALAEKRRVLGSDHPQTIDALENYGSFLTRKGDYAQAQAVLNEALQANIKTRGEHHAMVGYDRVNLGILDFVRGDYVHAEQEYRAALVNYEHSLPPEHIYVAGADENLGRVLMRQGKLPEALALLTKAERMFTSILGDDNQMTWRARAVLGITLVAAHRYDEAKPLLISARPYIERLESSHEISSELRDALAVINAATIKK